MPRANRQTVQVVRAIAAVLSCLASCHTHAAASVDFTSVPSLKLAWTRVIPDGPVTSPVAGGGRVYISGAGAIQALDAVSGAQAWAQRSCSGEGNGQLALGPHSLLVGDAGGDLGSYDLLTGKLLWCRDEGGSIAAPPALDSSAAYVCNGMELVAVEVASGDSLWRFQPSDGSHLANTPALDQDTVYATSDAKVFALDRTSGTLRWQVPLEAPLSAPAVVGNTVYVGGNFLYALDTVTGLVRWTSHAVGVNVTAPALVQGKVLVNSQDPLFGLAAFDGATGGLLWRSQAPGESGATVTVADGMVYDVAEDGSLFVFDLADGRILGTASDPDGRSLNSGSGFRAVVAGGRLFIATSDAAPGRLDVFALPPQPTLTAQAQGALLTISWPTSFSGHLQRTMALGAGSPWITLTNNLAGQNFLTLPIGQRTGFYRLAP